MADSTCPECGWPQPEFNPHPSCDCVCTGDVNCEGRALRLVKARLVAALKVARCGVDVRARLRTVDGSGAATIYFSAALAELNQLLPEADRVLVGQEQRELSLASATAVTQRQGETDG